MNSYDITVQYIASGIPRREKYLLPARSENAAKIRALTAFQRTHTTRAQVTDINATVAHVGLTVRIPHQRTQR